jgi:hypothetical protein
MKPTHTIALSALAAMWLAAMPARAETQTRVATTPAARLCTLSVPTTDTAVRPKATGFRNEGKANAFVICAFDSPPGQPDTDPFAVPWDPTRVELNFDSIDGKPHGFNCTGVNSWNDRGAGFAAPMQYVTKTVSVLTAGDGITTVAWTGSDYGESYIPSSGNFSVTCTLPPGVAILFGGMRAQEDIGS